MIARVGTPGPLRRRQGTLLIVVLVVMLAISAVVGGLQFVSLTTVRQARYNFTTADALFRVEGVLHLLISRWKKEIQYLSTIPLTSPPSGSEEGSFDGMPYVYGWERESLDVHPPAHRMSIWVRFTTEKPLRTFRWDVTLRTPSALDPQILDLRALSIDNIDPADESERRLSFAQLAVDPEERREREARVEACSSAVRHHARLARDPAEIRAAVSPGSLDGASSTMKQCLQVLEELEKAPVGSRTEAAQKLMNLAGGLPEHLQYPWYDLALFHRSREFLENARDPSHPDREGSLRRAMTALREIVTRDPESCGAVKAAWRLAQLLMIIRPDPSFYQALQQAKAEAQDLLNIIIARAPRAPAHQRTQIERWELASFFEGLWRARVAASLRVPRRDAPDSFLLVSMREDGAYPVVHLESASPVRPLAWQVDGSEIFAASELAQGTLVGGRDHQTVWRVSLDGSEVIDVFSEEGDQLLAHVLDLDITADGGAIAAMGLVQHPLLDRVRRRLAPRIGKSEYDWEKWKTEQRLSGAHEWLAVSAVRGDRRIVRDYKRRDHSIVAPFIFSPDSERVMLFSGARQGVRRIFYWDLDRFFELDPDDAAAEAGEGAVTTRTPAAPPVFPDLSGDSRFDNAMWATAREALPVGDALVTGLSWIEYGRYPPGGSYGWIGVAALKEDSADVYFIHASPTRLYPLPPVTVDARVRPADGGSFLDSARAGTLVRRPAGYVLAGADRLHFIPLPGREDRHPARQWPENYLGRIRDIRHLEAPPWGGVLFFIAREGGSPEDRLFVLDMHTGKAEILIGTRAGAWPAEAVASRLAVSPIPDRSLEESP